MSGQVVDLRLERCKRAIDAQPAVKAALTAALDKPGVPVITEEQNSTLGALWRRFHQEADQLIGFMEHIGIAGDSAKQFRKQIHVVRSEILAARVRRDLAK